MCAGVPGVAQREDVAGHGVEDRLLAFLTRVAGAGHHFFVLTLEKSNIRKIWGGSPFRKEIISILGASSRPIRSQHSFILLLETKRKPTTCRLVSTHISSARHPTMSLSQVEGSNPPKPSKKGTPSRNALKGMRFSPVLFVWCPLRLIFKGTGGAHHCGFPRFDTHPYFPLNRSITHHHLKSGQR